MRNAWDRFWRWYRRHYLATLVITTGVFLLQLFHLYWLFSDVIVAKLTGQSAFVFPRPGTFVYVLADYLEIPALVSATLLYVYELRRGVTPRAVLYIVLLNTQWVHMFWITDQVVLETSLTPWSRQSSDTREASASAAAASVRSPTSRTYWGASNQSLTAGRARGLVATRRHDQVWCASAWALTTPPRTWMSWSRCWDGSYGTTTGVSTDYLPQSSDYRPVGYQDLAHRLAVQQTAEAIV